MRATPLALAGLIAFASSLSAGDETAPATSGAKEPEKPRLRLGPFGYGSPQEPLPTPSGVHFETRVDVLGQAPRDPNVAIAAFMKDLHLDDQAIYKGAGPTATSAYGTPIMNLVPVVKALIDKIKDKDKTKDEPQP